jgi:outer membrane biosynthesis protein TonB
VSRLTVRRAAAVAGAGALALVLAGCASSPRSELRDASREVLAAANDRDADATAAAADELLSVLRSQVASGDLTDAEAEPLRAAALAVRDRAGLLEPEPSPSPEPSEEPSPEPEPEPSPEPSPEPEPTQEPSPPPEPTEPPPTVAPEPSPPDDDGADDGEDDAEDDAEASVVPVPSVQSQAVVTPPVEPSPPPT